MEATRLERGAAFAIRWRKTYLVLTLVVTGLMILGSTRVRVTSSFEDLMPSRSPIIKVFKKYLSFGSPLTIQILLETKDGGSIFTPKHLKQIFELTRDVDLLPGVDHETINSIAATKTRVVRAVANGVESRTVMPDVPPTTKEGALTVRQLAMEAPAVRGLLVSKDETATMVSVAFHNRPDLPWEDISDKVHALCAKYSDADTELYPAGLVMLTGWIYHFARQTVWIFVLSFALIAIAHLDYMRSVAGAATPVIAALFSAVWGVGAGGWLNLNLEPLTLVIPVLLIARALSHSIQMTRRYYELLAENPDQNLAAAHTLQSMFPPATLGIACDAVGLYMLMLVHIPIIEKLGLFAGTWSMLIIPSVVILTPCLLAVLPAPKGVKEFVSGEEASLSTRAVMPVQDVAVTLSSRRWRIRTAMVLAPLSVVMVWLAFSREVGNASTGTPLLWPKNEFNLAMNEINRKLAGITTLDPVWHGKAQHSLLTVPVYESMIAFQTKIEREHGAAETLSIADNAPLTSRVLAGGDPRWLPVDPTTRDVGFMMYLSLLGRNIADLSLLADSTLTDGTVALWYRDLLSKTVERAMNNVRGVVSGMIPPRSANYDIELAAGPVALQYATDEVVRVANVRILLLLLSAIFFLCALTYGSLLAALMLITPLTLAQFATDAIMYLRGVGLDSNTLPVIAVGLGIGIDYGIYLLSRMCEEFQRAKDGDIEAAVERAVKSTGEAICFTAVTMVVAVLPWYFMSGLRFLADMGFMLALVLAFNAILALIVLPLLVVFARPRFLGRVELMSH